MGPKAKDQRGRRTVKACVICHKKKVRCDIDDVSGEKCTPCTRDGYDCIPRERKRKRFTFSPSPPNQRRVKTQDSNDGENSENEQLAFGDGVSTRRDSSLNSEMEMGRRLSTTAHLPDASPLLRRHTELGYPTPHNSNPSTMVVSALPSLPASHQSKNASYLGRLEYLRNDVPVNDEGDLPNKVPHQLSDTDLEILRIQRAYDLPPRPIRESLIDVFWTRCYPWTPVVDRSWIEDRDPNHISLLLLHAIFLAGSRVSTPLPDYPPEVFYKRARLLFWMGAEENPMITISAALLLHWFNPEGPEHVSLDTSSFWLRVCTGVAYQIGLHREPEGKPDAGLRRRIWWSLVVRDCLINAGHGRPRAIDLKLADVTQITALDFDGMVAPAQLFASYVGISCILGDLTQSYLRKHGLQEQKTSLEDRLFRWLKTLPENLQLCRPTEDRPLKGYSFEARQIHAQYFTTLVILNRSTDPKLSTSASSLLASSFVAGIFEDFLARDELRYLGPIFTFYCLTAGMAQLSCYRYTGLVDIAEENLAIMAKALEELSKRWPTAIGSLKHLMDVREKIMQRPPLAQFPEVNLPNSTLQFFSDFGPDLCRMWHPIHQRLSQITPNVHRELETAEILQGLRTPMNQPLELDFSANALAQQQMMGPQVAAAGPSFNEPTLLQPQEWLGLYGGIGNWLMVDWDQSLGW
ncbi:hypothetical protein P154DRAFT_625204 [Amniculicola lignicola CBS 123094]|uniref:Zn(2)-C6 fungal-type domain-containing protein n=1 Tax=Amniculicola lignicola CBS 123094 TaxID=1392246 RepID=A0A6A5VWH9_9PLEO|nr:hypothetical protein P154DRAFT_625204 [Amniculicola lignicola CBS 123094]